MGKSHWKSYELKKLGVHHKSALAILRIQRKQIYADRKQAELKFKAMRMISSLDYTALISAGLPD